VSPDLGGKYSDALEHGDLTGHCGSPLDWPEQEYSGGIAHILSPVSAAHAAAGGHKFVGRAILPAAGFQPALAA
jgi:hypothetical protein